MYETGIFTYIYENHHDFPTIWGDYVSCLFIPSTLSIYLYVKIIKVSCWFQLPAWTALEWGNDGGMTRRKTAKRRRRGVEV